jgi:hypothetical protein
MNIKESLIGGVIGALATVAVGAIWGAIFSSATISFISGIIRNQVLPSDAVILVNAPKCPDSWTKVSATDGRYLVLTGKSGDGPDFQGGSSGGRQLDISLGKENLPSFEVPIEYMSLPRIDFINTRPVYRAVLQLGYDPNATPPTVKDKYDARFTGDAKPIRIEPQWYALTPCRR